MIKVVLDSSTIVTSAIVASINGLSSFLVVRYARKAFDKLEAKRNGNGKEKKEL